MILLLCFFFFNDTATTEIYTLSLHDALPISEHPDVVVDVEGLAVERERPEGDSVVDPDRHRPSPVSPSPRTTTDRSRSEEHTSELQSRQYLVCRLLLEKKRKKNKRNYWSTSR